MWIRKRSSLRERHSTHSVHSTRSVHSRRSSRSRRREAGLTTLELALVATFTAGTLIVAFQANQSIHSSFKTTERDVSMNTSATVLLDNLDSQLRSSSLDISPIRVFDAASPFLSDGIDNDGDQQIDEADEGYYGASALAQATDVQGVWFTRVLSIDDRFVPPQVLYADPSYVTFEIDANEQPDGRDNDSDGLIDEGRVILMAGEGRAVVARDVTDFRVRRDGDIIRVVLRIERQREGKKTPLVQTLYRNIFPRNG